MKTLIPLIALMIYSGFLLATEQQPDILFYNGNKLDLETGWGHPSPLQTYFYQNSMEYPFPMLHTANYRGHIATWEISDNQLFLKEIQIKEEKYSPANFNVKSKSDTLSSQSKVFADWFSGVIIGEKRNEEKYWKTEQTYYFHIKYGKIVDVQEFTKKDFDAINNNIWEPDSSNYGLMAKHSILILNQNYISYYYRLYEKDTILYKNRGGYLSGNFGLSPIMLYYSNDHMQWPFNWENRVKSGAPHCAWKINNDSLFLTNIELYTGTGFYSIEKIPVDLSELFPDRTKDRKFFGDWISGIFVISYGENVEDENLSGYFEFKASEYTYLRIKDGIITENYTIPVGFDIKNILDGTDEGLRKILEEME